MVPPRDSVSEQSLSDFFETYGARGERTIGAIARHPIQLVRAWRAIQQLPVVDAELSSSSEGEAVRRGLRRTSAVVRALIRGTTAVLAIPEDGDSYFVGSNESKRTLRTKTRRAERRGFTVSMPTSHEERSELLRLSEAYEQNHPDPIYRNQVPCLDRHRYIRTWLVARDATGKPLLVSVIPVDGEWGVLAYFKTLENSDDARLARHWLSGVLVQHLAAMGVRYLADESSPVGLPSGLRSFQRRLGYRLVRVRIKDRASSPEPHPPAVIREEPRPASRAPSQSPATFEEV